MAEDEYELLPRGELDYLRKEIDRLKRNPLGDTQASVSLLESLNKLNDNVAKLVQILESANDDMVRMAREGNVQEQLKRLREENAKIAHGIVAVAELVKGKRSESVDEIKFAQPESEPAAPAQRDLSRPFGLQLDLPAGEPQSFDFNPEEPQAMPLRRNPFLNHQQQGTESSRAEPDPPRPPRADEIPPPPR